MCFGRWLFRSSSWFIIQDVDRPRESLHQWGAPDWLMMQIFSAYMLVPIPLKRLYELPLSRGLAVSRWNSLKKLGKDFVQGLQKQVRMPPAFR